MNTTEARDNLDKNTDAKEDGLCLTEFKKRLGTRGVLMSDAQIKKVFDVQCNVADILLDKWLGEQNRT